MSDTDKLALMADDDKPREKALKFGVKTLTDAELLAIMLRVGIQGKNVLEVAREILRIHGNDLANLAGTTPPALARMVPGMGPTKAITVAAAIELGVRARGAMARRHKQNSITGAADLYDHLSQYVEMLAHEEFWVVMLSQKLSVMSCQRISQGGMAATVVDLRLLFKRVLDSGATTIAVAHNHPSGQLRPSMQDDTLTHRIVEAAKLLDVRVIDHLIITADGYYSYADQGRLN